MTILHSCCCWRSVRHGTIACGVYTGIYYTVNAFHSSYLLREEIRFLKNNSKISMVEYYLGSGSRYSVSSSAVFSSLIFAFSSCGIISTLLLFYGIYKDIKYLLIPWIFNMIFFTIVDVVYVIHGLAVRELQWSPSVAILITVDFFLNMLHFYAVLCVISQYQEYKAGRGKAIDVNLGESNQHISLPQPTATSHFPSKHRKPPIIFDKDDPPSSSRKTNNNRNDPCRQEKPKKCVKFGDCSRTEKKLLPPLWEEPKRVLPSNGTGGVDTTPLIDTGRPLVPA